MRIKHIHLLLVFVFFLIGCKQDVEIPAIKAEQEIEINLDLRESIDIDLLTIIPLESVEHSTIGKAKRVAYSNDRIFVLDNSISMSLFSFDEKGKFIRKLLNGKGPGECSFPWDFYIDHESESVTLFDQRLFRFSEYDFDLNFKNAITKQIGLQAYTKTPDNKWLVWFCGHLNKETNKYHLANLFDEEFNNTTARLVSYPAELVGYGLNNPLSREEGGEVLFAKQYDQNLYTVRGDAYAIKYHLDFGPLNLRKDDYSKDTRAPFALAKDEKRVTSIDNLINDESWLSFSFLYGEERKYIIHSKKTEKNYYSKYFEDQHLLPHCILAGIHKGSFVGVVQAKDFLDFLDNSNDNERSAKYDAITINDNPIIILFNVEELVTAKN